MSQVTTHPVLFAGHCRGMLHGLKVRPLPFPGRMYEGGSVGIGVHIELTSTAIESHVITFLYKPSL